MKDRETAGYNVDKKKAGDLRGLENATSSWMNTALNVTDKALVTGDDGDDPIMSSHATWERGTERKQAKSGACSPNFTAKFIQLRILIKDSMNSFIQG